MPVPLYDAHNHLAAEVIQSSWASIEPELQQIGLQTSVVNGTHPEDWPAVLGLAKDQASILPAIGLHPWKLPQAPEDWQAQFIQAFEHGGAQVVGEIGLDQWIEGHDIDSQQTAFRWQIAFATERNLPLSIHCLRAIGPLMDTLRAVELPKRGIHIHAYNGSVVLIDELVELGAYFSFNGGQLKPKAKTAPAVIAAVPSDRLLIETDAPDMLPPPELRYRNWIDTESDTELSHPANILTAYQAVAKIRQTSLENLATQVADNFHRYFSD